MAAMMKRVSDAPLLSFFIASADMTYNEIAEREVYLLGDEKVGYALRGEIAGCGEGCYTDLNQVLLVAEEYGLAIVPGAFFSRFGGDWIRFPYATPPEKTQGALQRFVEALTSLK